LKHKYIDINVFDRPTSTKSLMTNQSNIPQSEWFNGEKLFLPPLMDMNIDVEVEARVFHAALFTVASINPDVTQYAI